MFPKKPIDLLILHLLIFLMIFSGCQLGIADINKLEHTFMMSTDFLSLSGGVINRAHPFFILGRQCTVAFNFLLSREQQLMAGFMRIYFVDVITVWFQIKSLSTPNSGKI